MKKLCTFGKEIKTKLVAIDRNQKWLVEEVKKDTHGYFDSGYLHRIMTGELTTPKIITSIKKILDI